MNTQGTDGIGYLLSTEKKALSNTTMAAVQKMNCRSWSKKAVKLQRDVNHNRAATTKKNI